MASYPQACFFALPPARSSSPCGTPAPERLREPRGGKQGREQLPTRPTFQVASRSQTGFPPLPSPRKEPVCSTNECPAPSTCEANTRVSIHARERQGESCLIPIAQRRTLRLSWVADLGLRVLPGPTNSQSLCSPCDPAHFAPAALHWPLCPCGLLFQVPRTETKAASTAFCRGD